MRVFMHCLLTAGAKLSRTSEGIRIIESDGSFLQLTSEAGVRNLSQDIQQRWQYAQQVSHRVSSARNGAVTALAVAQWVSHRTGSKCNLITDRVITE